MLGFPQVIQPSSLLCVESLSLAFRALNEECGETCNDPHGGHRSLDLLYQEIMSSPGTLNAGEQCILLLRLTDIARQKGKLGLALDYSGMAECLVRAWPAVAQRHNHAVALYAQALIYHALGSEVEALRKYAAAEAALVQVKQQWQLIAPRTHLENTCVRHCDQVIPLVREIQKYVARSHRFGGTNVVLSSTLVGAWPLPKGLCVSDKLLVSDQAIVDLEVRAISAEMKLRCDGVVYRLEKPGGEGTPEPLIEPTEEHWIIRIPEEQAHSVRLQGADYALVRVGAAGSVPKTTHGTPEGQATLLSFRIDKNGNLRVRETNDLAIPKLVGEGSNVTLTVVGIFKKVQ